MKKMKWFLIIGIISILLIGLVQGDKTYITPAWNGNTEDLYQFSSTYYYLSNNANDSIYINLPDYCVFDIENLTIFGNISIYLYNSTYNYIWYIYPSQYQNTTLPISVQNITFTSGMIKVFENITSDNTIIYINNQSSYTSNILYDKFFISGQGQASFTYWSLSIFSTPIKQDFTILIFGLSLFVIGILFIYFIGRINRW
jgi:hypothetical protein